MATIKGTEQNDIEVGTAGNDKIFGDDGNDTLYGGLGSDDLNGGAGDDFLYGGAGNDALDGGKGFDTAVYTGDMDDYGITAHNGNRGDNGNNKWTISDDIANRDGTDQLKDVERLQFNDGWLNLETGDSAQWDYSVNDSVDPSAEATPGVLFAGSGIPNTGFGIAHNDDAGVELGLQIIYRQGPVVTSTDNYNDGVLHFTVNDGPQSTANGSSGNNATRAAWNFEYSVATGLDGETTDLDDFTFKLMYDTDTSAATSFRTLVLEAETTPQAAGQSGYQWRDEGTGLVFIADDEGNGNVTQNSENYAFNFFQTFMTGTYGPANSFGGPATFDLILQAYDGSDLIAQNHIVVDVIV
jgi:hypothetical protein